MARLLQQFVESPRPCSYLPRETASLEYKVFVDVSPQEWERLLERGWRRFGAVYFRPRCSPCGECVSLRLNVATFQPSRSQRRALRNGLSLRSEVGPVRVDAERLSLYAAWHASREASRSWEASPVDEEDYESQFAFPHSCAREIAYYDDNAGDGKGPRLVGVGLCDETPNAWSAIYFFFHPDYAHLSPGVFHVVNLARIAAAGDKAFLYLGFRVNDCASMRYKAGFRPHELLAGRPADDEQPIWRRSDGVAPA